MNKKLIIVGSAKLQTEIRKWISYWKKKGFKIVYWPKPIPKKTFFKDYPEIFKEYFALVENVDTLFVMNEDKNGIVGYIGAETFAEMTYVVAQNLNHNKTIKIILLKMPSKKVQCYDEVSWFVKYNWIELFDHR